MGELCSGAAGHSRALPAVGLGGPGSAPACAPMPARGECPSRFLSSNHRLCKISSTLKEERKGAVHVGMKFSPWILADLLLKKQGGMMWG